jgi:hypothetical protein
MSGLPRFVAAVGYQRLLSCAALGAFERGIERITSSLLDGCGYVSPRERRRSSALTATCSGTALRAGRSPTVAISARICNRPTAQFERRSQRIGQPFDRSECASAPPPNVITSFGTRSPKSPDLPRTSRRNDFPASSRFAAGFLH